MFVPWLLGSRACHCDGLAYGRVGSNHRLCADETCRDRRSDGPRATNAPPARSRAPEARSAGACFVDLTSSIGTSVEPFSVLCRSRFGDAATVRRMQPRASPSWTSSGISHAIEINGQRFSLLPTSARPRRGHLIEPRTQPGHRLELKRENQ